MSLMGSSLDRTRPRKKISKLEDMSIETSQTEKRKGKRTTMKRKKGKKPTI